MDNRRIVTGLIASVAVFYLYLFIVGRYMPPPQATTRPAAEAPSTSRPAGTQPERGWRGADSRPATEQPSAAVGSWPASEPAESQGLIVEGGTDRSPIVMGEATAGKPYPMSLEILPAGGAVSRAAIRDHYRTVEKDEPYQVFSPLVMADAYGREFTYTSFVTPRIRFANLEAEADLSRVVWSVVEHDPERVTLGVTIKTPTGEPVARVLKTYVLRPQPARARSKANTYDLELSLTIENLSAADLDVILTQQGAIGFRKEEPRREDRRVVIARWQKDGFVSRGEFRAEILKNPGKIAGRDDDASQERVAWAAQTNMYFACIMAPAGRLNAEVPAAFASVEPVVLDPAAVNHQDDLTFRYITRPVVVAPGQSRQIGFDCYIGPKSKAAFEAVAAYRERSYYEVIRESFYFCAPDALVGLMMTLLDLFHRIPPHNYGVAIIILVLVVRLLLHPLTKKSQVNMTKMQDQQARLKPKLDALRQKFANDRVRMNQAQMELYREEGINPAGSMLSCLPMMLQLPIWAALWTALASMIEMRHAPFDGYWIRDLASPDAVYVFAQPVTIPLFSWLMGGPMTSINILPILLCISQMLQTKFMPKTQTPQPSEGMPDQRKMMMFMSVMFIFFLWNAPSGLNLYIMSSNFFGILEQTRIRKHLRELEGRREEDEAKRRAKVERRKQSWLYRKWQELAREAEDARKIKSPRDRKQR